MQPNLTGMDSYRRFDESAACFIKSEINKMICVQLKPKLIFWRCIDLLPREHIQLPSYNQLSELILIALNQRKKDLADIIGKELKEDTQDMLDGLFEQNSENKYARYKLTLLKNLSQSTKPAKIKERTDDLAYITELYDSIAPMLPVLNLGHEGIRYFATSVIKSDIFHLSRRANEDRYVHVTAFIAHQYYRLQDNLVDTLLSTVNSFQNGVKRYHKECCYEQRKDQSGTLKTLITCLDKNVFGVLQQIREITLDTKEDDTSKIVKICGLLDTHSNNIPQAEQQWQAMAQGLENEAGDKRYYDILEDRSLRLQNRVSPIIRTLRCDDQSGAAPILDAISYFKDKDGTISKNAPLAFLETAERAAVIQDSGFRPSLYKSLFFIHVANALKSGQLNLQHSYKYRPLDNYLIEKQRWRDEKETLLSRANLSEFVDHKMILDKLDQELCRQYEQTNRHITERQNLYLKIVINGDFTVATPKQEDQVTENLRPYFPERHFVPLPEILATVNSHTRFLEEFQHWQQRYAKNRTADKILYAGIIGLGCAIGIPKMGQIAPQINEFSLHHAVNWYFSLDNIRAANDRMIAFMDQMELPNVYRREQGKLHTASDGQKFEVRSHSLNANYSFKYFGKGQGISANTFVDERNLLWHSLVFSAADRESAYVIDGLMYNDVIKSDIHSTDTHGYSEAIFAVTHLLGFSYAPRIKNLKKQVLYIFRSCPKGAYADWQVTPDKYINRDIIEECWDDILRLIATIKLKETTASDIFRRLNSYSKQHRLYQALKAFGQIIKSDFILRYIDDVKLRQAIEKQLKGSSINGDNYIFLRIDVRSRGL
ncbi:MAG: Tn3 family transposase [Alphaproteobacteria bacterium]|nr:MAG: Tn3 family transposase [Alphaproteobacteria bacterium]TAF39798.1 MAG: Tn3 family transposase [Alphaproteobacteria bacterium]